MIKVNRAGLAFAVAMLALAPCAPSVASSARHRPRGLAGTWLGASDTRDITRVVVRRDKGGYSIRMWGRCHPTDCPWGETAGLVQRQELDPTLFAVYQPGFKTSNVSLRLTGSDVLTYQFETKFNDNSGRAAMSSEGKLRRTSRRV